MRPARNDRLLDAAERHRLLSDPTRLAVLEALRSGERTIPELVEVTGMHRNTVRNHVQKVLTKLGAHSKLEAVAIATRSGLLPDPRDTP